MKSQPLVVYLPDTRDVTVSRYGIGNLKLGFGVFTYSRLAGDAQGTCPGSTDECEDICYAKRIRGPVADVYVLNSGTDNVPAIPLECKVLRLHVSGDFDSVEYINNWIAQLRLRPDVTAWAYTRSWRVPRLLLALEQLRALPNMQLFASMDASTQDLPPVGWRRAWIWRDIPTNRWPMENRLKLPTCTVCNDTGEYDGEYGPRSCMSCLVGARSDRMHNLTAVLTTSVTPSYVCPEETGRKANCLACGYCFEGRKHDVVFLEH